MKFRLPQRFVSDIGIDLGTATTLGHVRGRGIVLSEPSTIAFDRATHAVVAVGTPAKAMLGRTPGTIDVIRPLKDGVIAHFDAAQTLLRHLVARVQGRSPWRRPRMVIGVPSCITPVEKRAVREAAVQAGAHAVYLVEEPVALGAARRSGGEQSIVVKGSDAVARVPKAIRIGEDEVREAVHDCIGSIVATIRSSLECTPPEIAADMVDSGIVLTGGGALLDGLDEIIRKETYLPVTIADEPLSCVVRGVGVLLEDISLLERVSLRD